MGLLGILSLIQIAIIPGILITAIIKSLSSYDRILLVLPLSLIANYFFVIILTALGIYSQTVLILILLTEILVLGLFFKKNLLQKKYAFDMSVLFDKEKVKSNTIRWLNILLLFLLAMFTAKQAGTVFTGADVVVNWNRWAIDWFDGISPRNTYHYPQLLPAIYSISYKFIGTVEVELFARLVPAFFPIMFVLTFLRMANLDRENRTLHLLALIIFWVSFSRMEGISAAFNGYADIPLAYFVLVTIFIFYLAWTNYTQANPGQPLTNTDNSKSNSNLLLLVAVIIAGGAITKHSALYLAAILPIAWHFHFRKVSSMRQIVAAYLVILVIAGHWFVYKQIQIYSGVDSSNLTMLSEIVALPWYAKLWHGIVMISSKISWLWIPLFFIGMAVPLARAHAIWIFIPFFLLWAIFASYDYRNLILALPSLAFILGSGMLKFHEYFTKTQASSRIYFRTAKAGLFLILSVIIFLLASPRISKDLISLNTDAKHAIGVPEFNKQLYAFFQVNPEFGKIASTYYALGHLPGLKDRDFPASCNDLESLADNHTVRYLIVEAHCPEQITSRLASRYTKHFEGKDLIFYEVVQNNEKQGSL